MNSSEITHFDADETNPAPPNVSSSRVKVIDYLRGSAMVLMAVDHSMSFAGVPPVAESYGGVAPVLGPPILVFIGLATNIASGMFFVLAGTSIVFFESSRLRKGWTRSEVTRFLLMRGAILLALDPFIEPYAWNVPVAFDTLSAIGFCIIVLALVRRLPFAIIGLASLTLFLIYPILVTSVQSPETTLFGFISTILLQFHPQGHPHVEFPLLARLSLVLLGNVFGRLIKERGYRISYKLIWLGVGGVLASLALRLAGGYGNFLPYRSGSGWMMFFIENKQPPSTVFLLFNLSLGVLLMVILLASQKVLQKTGFASILQLFGRTSLFFFIVHLLLYSKIMVHLADLGLFHRTWEIVIAEFVVGLVAMIFLCRAYLGLKERFPNCFLQYL